MKRYLLRKSYLLFMSITLSLTGCATFPEGPSPVPAHYVNPEKNDSASGIGIESQDIIAITDQMLVEILSIPIFSEGKNIPKIIVDAEYFKNQSSSRIDMKIITDRLRTELNRASKRKIIFVGREYSNMVLKEWRMKQAGIVQQSDNDDMNKLSDADYRLGGRINSLDSVDPKSGAVSRYHQIIMEIVDLKNSIIVWSGSYSFKKSAQEDIVYR